MKSASHKSDYITSKCMCGCSVLVSEKIEWGQDDVECMIDVFSRPANTPLSVRVSNAFKLLIGKDICTCGGVFDLPEIKKIRNFLMRITS